MLAREVLQTKKFVPSSETEELVDNGTHIGVEVETEGCGVEREHLDRLLTYWSVTLDGSLKSPWPYEFIFAQPLSGQDVVLALQELNAVLSGTDVQFPLNTSVHVHVNVGELTVEELQRFVYLSIVLESALIQYSGGRFDSCFCIPWNKVDPSILTVLGWFLEKQGGMGAELPKYTSMNFNSLFTLGTVEFRTMHGTCDNIEILDWINTILKIKQFATSNTEDPRAVLDYASSKKQLVNFLFEIFGEEVGRKMLHPKLHEEMVRSSNVARISILPKRNRELLEGLGVTAKEKVPKYHYKSVGYGFDTYASADLTQDLTETTLEEYADSFSESVNNNE